MGHTQALVGKPETETDTRQFTPPPSNFPDVQMPVQCYGTPIEEAAGNSWFLYGKDYEVGTRIEMPVVRTNNEAAILVAGKVGRGTVIPYSRSAC
jgi:hypothetical protein